MNITKSKLGVLLLLSIIPTTILFIIAGVIVQPGEDPTLENVNIFWTGVGLTTLLYWPCGIVAGLALTFWGYRERRREYQDTLLYAQLNGWHPISKSVWRNRKRNGTELAVTQTVGKSTYILTIKIEGETTAVDEFSTRIWALEFGDWLWEELLNARASTDAEVLAEKRDEWEQSRAMANTKVREACRRPSRRLTIGLAGSKPLTTYSEDIFLFRHHAGPNLSILFHVVGITDGGHFFHYIRDAEGHYERLEYRYFSR